MKKLFIIPFIVLTTTLISCKSKVNDDNKNFAIPQQECPEGINLIPMYGHAKKCQAQLDADKKFIEHVLQDYGSLKEGSIKHVWLGWQYLEKNDYETAMKRFNQAWLLDSLNADVYWGFGCLLREQRKIDEAIEMFNRSIDINPENEFAYEDRANAYNIKFNQTSDIKYLDEASADIRKAAELSSENTGDNINTESGVTETFEIMEIVD